MSDIINMTFSYKLCSYGTNSVNIHYNNIYFGEERFGIACPIPWNELAYEFRIILKLQNLKIT